MHGSSSHWKQPTVKCCKKYCMSNATDGTDDDMLWYVSEEDVDVRSECEKDEGSECKHRDRNTEWER